MGKLYKALEKVEKDRIPGNEPVPQPEIAPPAEEVKPDYDRRPYMEMPREVRLPSMDEKLVAYREPGSIAAEQFRKLRTQLLGMRLPTPPIRLMTHVQNAMAQGLQRLQRATDMLLHRRRTMQAARVRQLVQGRWTQLPVPR